MPYRTAAACSDLSGLRGRRRAQLVEQHEGREAVRNLTDLALELADGDARLRPDDAVDLPRVEAVGGQPVLQILLVGQRHRRLVARPLGDELAAAADAVGEVGDGKRIADR